jgi:hypothetical protein
MAGQKVGGVDFYAMYASSAQKKGAADFEAKGDPAVTPPPEPPKAENPSTGSFEKRRSGRI